MDSAESIAATVVVWKRQPSWVAAMRARARLGSRGRLTIWRPRGEVKGKHIDWQRQTLQRQHSGEQGDTVGGGASKLNDVTDHPGPVLPLTLRWGRLPGSPCQSGGCETSASPGLGL
ncbi:MAG: hypothetical protein FRX49_10456 [Trebouxia sp. A1-2]|nr:MAG: hypothetical protein FRX49_10456 [Trebouxia sp. A1-2]